MKHFFFPYDESPLSDLLEKYVYCSTEGKDEGALKAYYDITDIIYDKRLDQSDEQLKNLLTYFGKNKKEVAATLDKNEPGFKGEHLRLRGLKLLWYDIEQQYKKFTADKSEIFCKTLIDTENANQQYSLAIKLALYHLVRGNLCLRISQCYYESFDLEASDDWGNKGIEILWHGKNLVAALRDSATAEKKVQADLYLRLTKLNLAKYYRDYARKNRRSDFDAALDEFKQVRYRIEEEYGHTDNPKQKRQYALIWMDAIINIAKIHRRKYQVEASEREILFFYSCLKSRLQEKDSAFHNGKNRETGTDTIATLLEKVDKIISGREKRFDITGERFLEKDDDLPGLKRESFEKYDELNEYDRRRYFLLVLLELARIRRDLHLVDNYEGAIAIASIADQWSRELDKIGTYMPGYNIDALITISSSLRKYIKFQNAVSSKEPPISEIVIDIDGNEYGPGLHGAASQTRKPFTLPKFIDELKGSAESGHLKSKAEMVKWYCLYQQEPELLRTIEDKVGDYPIKTEEAEANCQLQFLKGLAALRCGKYDEAIEIFTKLLEANKKEMRYIRLGTLGLKARYLLANCYMSRAEFSKAEKILRQLHNELAVAQKSRKSQGVEGGTDAETDARVEIDLGYCCMQRGAYEEAVNIYKNMFGDGGSSENPSFGLEKVKQQRRIMGLNNYASCCIFSINDEESEEKSDIKEKIERERKEKIERDRRREKIETARRLFCYMDACFSAQDNPKESIRYEWNPETNLLKGYYTLCTGIEPGAKQITDEEADLCLNISKEKQNEALLKAFPYFQKACRLVEAFPPRYDLLNEQGMGNKAKYRNEVERISVYIISLTKLQSLYRSKEGRIKELNNKLKGAGQLEKVGGLFEDGFELTEQQIEYLLGSKRDLERFLLNFPANYKIFLKATIALAEWLLDFERAIGQDEKGEEGCAKAKRLLDQLYRSFSYITIYEERGAGVFNTLRDNSKFRFFTAAQRGRFCALLLAMYKPIKALKEDCCFSIKDKERTPNLVHYTSMETLKKILTEAPQKEAPTTAGKKDPEVKDLEQKRQGKGDTEKAVGPRFRINNCGYMNDVFEGKTFLKSIALISGKIESMQEPMRSALVERYFPQINRSHQDLLPSGSNVYIGSLSVKADSFPMWYGYSEKESGCNIEFGSGFFDIDGTPYLPRALRDYMLSKYTDQDYPLYIVQYIGSQFETCYKEYKKQDIYREKDQKQDFETVHPHGHQQSCGTEAILYNDLFRILRQIHLRWKNLDKYLESDQFENAVGESKDVIRAFAADRINEIRFLFKDADYEYEGEVRVIYTDSEEHPAAKNNTATEVPSVYVDIDRELEELTIRLGSRIEDATVDRYVTWLKHTKRVEKVVLAKQNRYTT